MQPGAFPEHQRLSRPTVPLAEFRARSVNRREGKTIRQPKTNSDPTDRRRMKNFDSIAFWGPFQTDTDDVRHRLGLIRDLSLFDARTVVKDSAESPSPIPG